MKQEDNARRAEFIWRKNIRGKSTSLPYDALLRERHFLLSHFLLSHFLLRESGRSNEFDPTEAW